jgi:hypothetical protein
MQNKKASAPIVNFRVFTTKFGSMKKWTVTTQLLGVKVVQPILQTV